jgi:hypothetical protein
MTVTKYTPLMLKCFLRGLSPFECYDVLSEEYPGDELPTLECIRAIYQGFEKKDNDEF